MSVSLKVLLLAGACAAISTGAFAADLMEPAPPGVVVDSSHNWDGMYVGGFIGYGVGLADQTGPLPPAGPYPTGGVDVSLAGALIGVTAGANTSVGNGIVLGVAGDLAWSNMGGTYTSTTFPGSLYSGTTQHINWTGSLRGRLGYDAGAFLPYLTAGLAVANATRVSGFSGNTANTTQIGYTVGAGVEFAVADNASIDVEYRYSNYGTGTYVWQPAGPYQSPEVGMTTNTISVGMNWKF